MLCVWNQLDAREIHSLFTAPDGVAAGMPATPSCFLLGNTLQAKAIAVPFSPLRLGHIAAGSLGHEHFVGTSITRVIFLWIRTKELHSTCILTVILSRALQAPQFMFIH